MTGRPAGRRAASAAVLGTVAFVVLSMLVATGITYPVDVAARDFFRPGGDWTVTQARADILVEGLQPRVVAALLVLAGMGEALRRGSWAPLAQSLACGFVGGLAALAAKLAVGRPDPSNDMSTLGGSYPSGHVVSVLVCLGGAVLVVRARPHWWQWGLVLSAAVGMGHGMLVLSAHWLTDVVGGAVLGLTVLTVATVHVSSDGRSRRPACRGVGGGRTLTSPDEGLSAVVRPSRGARGHAGSVTAHRTFRIAIVHSFYSSRQSSGENHVVAQQVDVLRQAGHTVALVSRTTDDHEGRWAYSLRAAATVATGIGPDPVAHLDAFAPDVVLVNNLFPNYGRTWVDRWTGPLVAVMHNYRPMCANGTFFRDGEVCTDCLDRGDGWAAVRHSCYRGNRAATLPLALSTRFGRDPLLRRADRVVVLNRRMQGLYERGGVDAVRIRRVPNFLSRPPSPGPGGAGWLFVGRLTEAKGILALVRQWPEGVPLTVVGSGPLADEVAMTAPDSVVLVGEQSPDRVAHLMGTSRGLVFPSRWFEGFPMVYLEALAAGTPVLAWEPSAVADLVAEEATGLVVTDLVSALAEADTSFPALRGECRSVFEDRYTHQAWLSSMEDLFSELAGSSAR